MNKPDIAAVKNAKDLVNRLAILFRIGHTYSIDNEAVIKAIDVFVEAVNLVLLAEKTLTIELLGEYFYVNQARVKYTVQYYLNFDFLMSEFRKRGLGSITYTDKISCRDQQDFIKAFLSCLSSDSPYVTLMGGIETIESISIGTLKQARQDNILNKRQTLRRTYFNAIAQFKAVSSKARAKESIEIKKAKLVVNTLIDLMLQEEQMMISMTAIKDYDEYTFHHSVNVSILSLALGMKLGLSKKRLSELGIAAFLHDIGKIAIPDEILNKSTSFTDEEWETMKLHPVEGVKTILNTMKIDQVTIRSAVVAYEHHLNFDGSGYPEVQQQWQTNLYSNIVTIADRFDAMTSARVYSREPKSPEVALQILIENAGKHVDPILLKIFIKMTGVYPIGTLVVLDTRELGIVYRGNPDYPDRPVIVLLVDHNGKKVEKGLIDLSDKGLDGNYRRTIKKTLDYNKYKINLSEYLLDAYS
jgi:HD-GYP domain-containing protein (c-di-GMP phosphodiesterase class II)